MIAISLETLALAEEFYAAPTLPAPPPDDCEDEVEPCHWCDGTGALWLTHASAAEDSETATCVHCGGSGR